MFAMRMILNLCDRFLRGLYESSVVYEVSRKSSEVQVRVMQIGVRYFYDNRLFR